MSLEVWKPLCGYEVSDQGRFRKGDRILKGWLDKDGYRKVKLNGREYFLHTLVAHVFLGPVPVDRQVLHGPEGRECNAVRNLRYGTHWENQQDKYRDGTMPKGPLADWVVREIRELWDQGVQQKVLAQRFNVNVMTISRICRYLSYKDA